MIEPPQSEENVFAGVAAAFLFCLILFPVLVSAAPLTFEQAKVELRQKVYHDRNQGQGGDLYCGCDWRWVGRSGGRVDASSCGYRVRAQPIRGERTEWEHIVAASTFGRQRQCWQQGGRSNCTATDPVFNKMEADMHNLAVVVGELNADRSNYNFGVLVGTPLQHGSCPMKVDNRQRAAEPPDSAKGKIARVNFYMHDRYGLAMSRQQQQLFMAWDRQYPVTGWELERNKRIALQMGHGNPYVNGERTWTLGQRPSGEGLASPAGTSTRNATQPRQPASATGKPIIGNSRSKVYHLPVGCPSYGQVSERNQIQFRSVAEAESSGYRQAGNCRG